MHTTTKSRIDVFNYPLLRYMGSKHKLIPWIKGIIENIHFESALDPFTGSGAVAYLLKLMGKVTYTNDYLRFPYLISKGVIENSTETLHKHDVDILLAEDSIPKSFIRETFSGVFYNYEDLYFLDLVSNNIRKLENEYKQALCYAALFRSCIKKQPRGVFTISGALERYNDGRRDLKLSLKEHFFEQVEVYNSTVFANGFDNLAYHGDVFALPRRMIDVDLVYMDPPYVPRSDDNDYVKRYHFLEGLSSYWENERIMEDTKVKKIVKKFTPFSYRRTALEAFDNMFEKFQRSVLVLSYSSNGYPDFDTLVDLMARYKKNVNIHKRPHKYHFGTHSAVNRADVEEYLIVGI